MGTKDKIFDFSQRTYIIGVLNVTPDSFYDGGRFLEEKDAIKHGTKMAEEGADIIDIGGLINQRWRKRLCR